MLIPIYSISFQESEYGKSYDITASHWTTSLGSKLCIVHVDTRPLNQTKELFSPTFSWSELEGESPGLLNHYLYAAIHGYRYHSIHANTYPLDSTTNEPERDNAWKRVPALASVLTNGLPPQGNGELFKDSTSPPTNERCEVVVLLDADAIFEHLELPFEWLMNRWNVTQHTSIAMPLSTQWNTTDPNFMRPLDFTHNSKGDLNPNDGFIVALNLPRTMQILDAWNNCPDDNDRFPGCMRFKKGWLAELGAFGEYMPYTFDRDNEEGTDLRILPCTEANGFKGQNTDCEGIFVRHFSTAKHRVKDGVAESIARPLMAMMQSFMMDGNVRIKDD